MHNQNVNEMGKPSTYWMNISPYLFLMRHVFIISYVSFFFLYMLYPIVQLCKCVWLCVWFKCAGALHCICRLTGIWAYLSAYYHCWNTTMGVDICQYRQAIGLFNQVKFVKCQHNVTFVILPMIILSSLLITLLLFIAGLELNPGPNVKIKTLKVCHLNIRGLNQSKLNAIQTSLCQVYDVITISETFLNNNTVNSDLALTGFQEIIRRDQPTLGGGG